MTRDGIYQCDLAQARALLRRALAGAVSAGGLDWLDAKTGATAAPGDFYMAFSACPRFVGKAKLVLSGEDLSRANAVRSGWSLNSCTADRAARILLALSFPHADQTAYRSAIEALLSSADLNEQVALYSALPLFPYPADFAARAAEGIRTNIRDVFDAVALDNPYPADYLGEDAWNQMVLKAVFTERPLARVYGLEKRSNAKLSAMLKDYAAERRAAGRPVPEDVWRCVDKEP